MAIVIGIGYKARSGKDTAAEYLVKKYPAFKKEAFAFPIKETICREICGFSNEQLYGQLKEIPDPIWGIEPRKMYQMIGDALQKVNQNFFTIPMKRKVEEHIHNNYNVVISDVRFGHEIECVKKLGGYLVRIERTELPTISDMKHQSETALDQYSDWDYTIHNNGTVKELYQELDKLWLQISTKPRVVW